MKSSVQFPISSYTKLHIRVGDKITPKTPLAERIKVKEIEEVISLAKILKVKDKEIAKYLRKNIGDDVVLGDVLAEKKGLFSSYLLKSPFSGELVSLDLKQGTLILKVKSPNEVCKIFSPIVGKVKNINKNYIDIEAEVEIFPANFGEGEEVWGKIKYFLKPKIDILDVCEEIEGYLLCAEEFMEEVLVKLEVMGAKGLVVTKKLDNCPLPYVVVNGEILKKITTLSAKNVWIRPKEKEIIVWE